MFSIKRISRLSPILQQFSCTFVKPTEALIVGFVFLPRHFLKDFNQLR